MTAPSPANENKPPRIVLIREAIRINKERKA